MIINQTERDQKVKSLKFTKEIQDLLLSHEVNEDFKDYFQEIS